MTFLCNFREEKNETSVVVIMQIHTAKVSKLHVVHHKSLTIIMKDTFFLVKAQMTYSKISSTT